MIDTSVLTNSYSTMVLLKMTSTPKEIKNIREIEKKDSKNLSIVMT